MNPREKYQSWIGQNARIDGVCACGIALNSGEMVYASFDDAFPAAAVENSLRGLADTFKVIHLHRFPATHVRWAFEQGQICCAQQANQALLAVYLPTDSARVDTLRLEQLFEAFKNL